MQHLKKLALICVSLCTVWVVTGCTGLNTFPVAARGGDTIYLAVGSVEGLTKENITVSYTADSDGTVVDLTPDVQALVKLYPDLISYTALNDTNLYFHQGHEPWLNTMALNLPLSIADGGSMPIGTGKIRVSCVPREDCTVPFTVNHNNDIDIALEILPGTGASHPYEYDAGLIGTDIADPATLAPVQHVKAATTHPEGITFSSVGGPVMGAAEFVVNVPTSSIAGGAVPDDRFVIVSDDISNYTGSQRSLIWKRSGDQFKVIVVSHVGMKFTELNFSIAMKKKQSSGAPFIYPSAPTVVSEKYFDIDGNEITSGMPTLGIEVVGPSPS